MAIKTKNRDTNLKVALVAEFYLNVKLFDCQRIGIINGYETILKVFDRAGTGEDGVCRLFWLEIA
ncbi:MAG: hypothetical protein J7621_07245 [Niastella sp.]|nr:hypothetical protein [Niastella sp.]